VLQLLDYTQPTAVSIVTALIPRVLAPSVLDSNCNWDWVPERRPGGLSGQSHISTESRM
jgi:hypothetical protein